MSEPIRDNDAKGIGPFIWASLEMERMGFTIQNLDTHQPTGIISRSQESGDRSREPSCDYAHSYDLTGRRVTGRSGGIRIQNGRKFISVK